MKTKEGSPLFSRIKALNDQAKVSYLFILLSILTLGATLFVLLWITPMVTNYKVVVVGGGTLLASLALLTAAHFIYKEYSIGKNLAFLMAQETAEKEEKLPHLERTLTATKQKNEALAKELSSQDFSVGNLTNTNAEADAFSALEEKWEALRECKEQIGRLETGISSLQEEINSMKKCFRVTS